jgi:tripartite-type tricarboxylate transporter receptor subunit TctC
MIRKFEWKALLGAALLSLVASNAAAQAYPSRQITLIYPYAPGSAADAAWRTVTQEAGKQIGQSIIFENRPGAGGRIGLEAGIKGAKDGYTLGIANNALLIVLPEIDQTLKVEPGKDFTPIVLGNETFLVVASPSSVPFKDVRGLIAYAKANPGKLNGATSGAGSGGHLGLEMLKTMAGIDIVAVHYKGEAPAVTALVAGEVQIFLSAAAAKPHMESGKLIGYATTGRQRWSLFPNLPTVAESSTLKDFNVASWLGVIGPSDLPREVVAKVNQAFNASLNNTEVREKLAAAGWAVKGGTPEQFTSLIRADRELLRPVIKAANIKLDQ